MQKNFFFAKCYFNPESDINHTFTKRISVKFIQLGRIIKNLCVLTLLVIVTGFMPDFDACNKDRSMPVIDVKFPLRLSNINVGNTSNLVHLNDGIEAKIFKTADDFFKFESGCLQDSGYSYKETYVKTLRLTSAKTSVFVVLLHYFTGGSTHSKLLFYDNIKKEFIGEPLDFKLFALYNYENGKLVPTNLKKEFKIKTPEIDTVDYNNDGVTDYKLTRLFHNGTFNAIHETIVSVTNGKIDTLHFEETPLF